MLKILIFLFVSSNLCILVSSTDYKNEVKDSSSSSYSSYSSYSSSDCSSETETIEDDTLCKEHEKYVRCPSTLCRPLTCSQLGYPIPCPIIGPNGECPDKNGACICEDNYIRNDEGVCIPIKKCPSCGGDKNAVSGSGVNCGRHCSNYKEKTVACPQIYKFNSCDCKPKYVYDDNIKKCVLPKECTPVCRSNEVYSECTNGGCQAKNCSQVGKPVPCVKIDPKYCIKGCICKEGYLRSNNGTCVPTDQCNATTCGLNEVYSSCKNQICSFQNCTEVGDPIRFCPAINKTRCNGGCICKDEYLRNTKGICVPRNECDICHGDPNAFPGSGVNCGRLCSNYDKGPIMCPEIYKTNACNCKPDFVLDTNINKCVCPKDCTPTCGKDEVYNECVNALCRAANCSQKGKPIACPLLVEGACKGGCICNDGLLRADNGTCVPENQCQFNCTGPHEYYDCNVACDNVCATLDIQNKSNCPIINKRCNEMCYCEDGYARNDENICVQISQCESQKCLRQNEEWVSCPQTCPPQTCESIGKKYRCPVIRLPRICNGSCRCKKGFLRNKIGQCISQKNCLKCKGPNEYFSCGGACDNVCKTLHKQNQTYCPILNVKCNERCYCEKDYARNDNGTCIPIKDCKSKSCPKNEVWDECPAPCPPRRCDVDDRLIDCIKPPEPGSPDCKPACRCDDGFARNDKGDCIPRDECPQKCLRQNEEWVSCPQTCPPQTCESIGKKYHCPVIRVPRICKGSCRCKKGFLRNKIGQCISQKNCLKCKGPNEYFSCGGACDNVCKTLHKQNQTHCPIINIKCNERCYCEKDYARNDNGTCIPIKDCKSKSCPKNEVWDECPAPCPPRRCDVDDRLIKCIKPPEPGSPDCKPACRCADGFARNDKGECIPRDECPKKCPGQNEVWDSCPPICPPQTCESIGKSYSCPNMPVPAKCNGTCRCVEDYYRNKLGQCISKENCLKCTGPNEYYSCGGACDNVCATLHKQNQTNCPIINVKCNEMCYCEKDYARNASGICIPIKDCKPPPPKCPEGEILNNCPPIKCDAEYCPKRRDDPQSCPVPKKCGEPRCVCGFNQHRDPSTGKCIPTSKCPPFSCDLPNEEYNSCPPVCPGETCTDYLNNATCPKYRIGIVVPCKPQCRCTKGHWRNSKGICVSPKQCTKSCPKNEVWDECPTLCPARRCDIDDRVIKCINPPAPGLDCKPACRCDDGFARNDKGVCIPRDECPKKCLGQNEVWDSCPPICPPQTCESIGKSYSCPNMPVPAKCNGTCRCVEDYYRNKLGQCISKENCLKCTGPNEYYSCGGACDNVCATLDKQNQTNCPIINIKCNEMCYCEKDYARNASGICIPIKDCKPPPPKCPEGEILNNCPPIKCDAEYCPECRNDPQSCPVPKKCGEPRCVCGFNQHRDPCTGKCIATSDCPPFSCDLPNEEYNSCPPVCPGETCTDYLNNATCPKYRIGIVVPCKPQCRCTKGHWRNSKGICVSPKKCELEGKPTTTSTTTTSTTVAPPVDDGEAQKRFEEANIGFTGKFLDEVVKVNNGSSVIMSPFSVLFPLALMAAYTNGTSNNELMTALQFKNKNEIRSVIPALIKSYEAQQNVLFDLAFKLFINQNYQLSEDFLKYSKDVFDSEGQNVNFGDPKAAAKIINDWVASKTNNLITDLVSEQMFSELTRLVIANAIYFKGNWVKQFNPNATTDRDFYLPNNVVKKVKTMYQKGSFRYAESTELDAKILELPYKGQNFTYLAILPNKNDGLNELVTKLRDPNALKKAINSLETRTVIIYLPKIETSLQIDLSDILKKLGINLIFVPGKSGMYGILKKDEELYVSAAIQKATIIVNEIGSEAAAANAIIVSTTSAVYPPPEVYLFNADHPFLYYINLEDKPLFCGAYVGN